MATSPYSPIDSTAGEIRLLILLPSTTHSAPIHCSLQTVRLADHPVYEALSYTWGTVGQPDTIQIGPHKLQIWENIAAALRRLRLGKKERRLWIDAICINQSDIPERGQQVLLMRQIYGQAETVCVWLGELTDGAILGMKELQFDWRSARSWIGEFTTKPWQQWKIDAKYGKPTLPWTEQIGSGKGIVNRGNLLDEQSNGEVRELLERPWRRRTWIIQEAVLAGKITLMCGNEVTSWESIDGFFRQIRWTQPRFEVFGLPIHERDRFPDQLYRIISDLRDKWHSKRETLTLLDVVYRFRLLECSDARDKIYGFLGIVPEVVDIGLVPDYEATAATVYWQFALKLIQATGSLDVLNCKREWRGAEDAASRPKQAYSLLDQSRYYDVHALIVDGPGMTPRRGWARLPAGWERVPNEKRSLFKDHNTGLVHETSPLEGLPPVPAEEHTKQRTLPSGWSKRWNNLGCEMVAYGVEETPDEAKQKLEREKLGEHLSSLPSWVPNWAFPSRWDPQPLIEFPLLLRQYCASGNTVVQLPSGEPDPRVLSLKGSVVDEIAYIAPPWHPESDVAPVSRKGDEKLLAWEVLGLADVENCPYRTTIGRKHALWRTMIADRAGDEAAPDDDWAYVEAWYDRVGWAQDPPDLTSQGIWAATMAEQEIGGQESKMLYHFVALDPERYPEFGEKLRQSYRDGEHVIKRYGEYMRRIHRTCAHRALFVSKKGYIGLAPWNARLADQIVRLDGGRTPYIVRSSDASGPYTLVGEAYAYGMMDGEVVVGDDGRLIESYVVHIS